MIDHLADLESDFSVFHRVDDPLDLSGPEFFRKAIRLPAYRGVMAARVLEMRRRRGELPASGTGGRETPKKVPLSQVMAEHPDLIERR